MAGLKETFPFILLITLHVLGSIQGDKVLEKSVFGFPMLFPYKCCDKAPGLQSLNFQFTNLLDYSVDIVVFQIGGYSGVIIRLQRSLQEINTLKLIEPNSNAKIYYTCQHYFCDEESTREVLERSNGTCNHSEMITGLYSYVKNDPAILLTVNEQGPDYIHIYSALPRQIAQNDSVNEFEYHILTGSIRNNYTSGVAIMATYNCTDITLTPSVDVHLYTVHEENILLGILLANETDTVQCLRLFHILWMEEITENCSSVSTMSGTIISSSTDIAVYTAEVQCNNTQQQGTETKPFSFIASRVQQMPPTVKWGKKFIADVSHLKTLHLSSEGVTAVFYIQTSNISVNVSVAVYNKEKEIANIMYNVHTEQPLQFKLNKEEQKDITNVIIHSKHPIFVLYEVHSEHKNHQFFSTTVQPEDWYTHKQSVLLSHTLTTSYHIVLVTLKEHYKPYTILVSDQEHLLPVEHYESFESYTVYTIDQYTVLQIYINSSAFNISDKTLVFNYSSTNPCGKLGATVFAHGMNIGYAYSNGYVLDDSSLTNGTTCSQPLNFYAIIGGIVGLVTLVVIVVTCVILKLLRVPGVIFQPEPPPNDFEFDVFLSFADKDKDFVERYLYDPLKRKGYLVLWHHSDFIPGLTISENIIRAVQTSRRIIFVCSEHFNQSDFCEKELKFGVDSHYNKYKGKYRRVVPVVIQEGQCPPVLRQLRPIKVHRMSLRVSGDQHIVKKLNFGKSIQKNKKKTKRERKRWLKGKKKKTSDEDTINLLSPVSGDPV